MRSLWTLLILMAACSFVAQRKWRALFQKDTFKALLKLPGYSDLSIVKAAQKAQPYNTLLNIESAENPEAQISSPGSESTDSQVHYAKFTIATKQNELTSKVIKAQQKLLGFNANIVDCVGEQNEYNHQLDYYSNQLIYILLGNRMSQLSDLNLRSKLIMYSILSTTMTAMQFVLPWLFIGEAYIWYGWEYLKVLLRYISEQIQLVSASDSHAESRAHWNAIVDGKPLMSQSSANPNSIDYEISVRIWPTSTKCRYIHYGLQGLEQTTVQCAVPINEICAKLFAVIWWFVAINIAIEVASLIGLVLSSINKDTIRSSFGRRFWSDCMEQIDEIAAFKFRHMRLLQNGNDQSELKYPPVTQTTPTGTFERKRIEVEQDRLADTYWTRHSSKKSKGFRQNIRELSPIFIGRTKAQNNFDLRARADSEACWSDLHCIDSTVYYVFYLLYLRLNKNKKDVQQVIQMTSTALNIYLTHLVSALDILKNTTDSFDANKATGVLVSNGKVKDHAASEPALGQARLMISTTQTQRVQDGDSSDVVVDVSM